MIISAQQPYFCPYPGFFSKALHSDVLVLLDTVQFPQGGTWITRNRFKNDRGTFWINVPVRKKGRGLQRIDEVRICRDERWEDKHLKSILHAYGHAPYLREYLPLFERAFSGAHERVADLNCELIRCASRSLGARARVLRLSETGVQTRGPELAVNLCLQMGAERFLAFGSSQRYLDREMFSRAGIELLLIDPPRIVYPQLWGPFIPNLSVFDLLLNCGPKSREIMERGGGGIRQAEP